MVSTSHLLILSAVLFALGMAGVVIRRNVIIVMMCIELMLNAVNVSFVAFARQLGSIDGHIIVFFVMAVAAAEAGVGLALVIAMFRHKSTVNLDHVNLMKG